MKLTKRGETVLATVVVILCIAVVVAAFVVGQHLKRERLGQVGPAQSITCQEDMPCWDCNTMGNRKCGS